MISDIGFFGLKYSIGTALKYWEYVAFKYWDRDRRDIFGIGTALLITAQWEIFREIGTKEAVKEGSGTVAARITPLPSENLRG